MIKNIKKIKINNIKDTKSELFYFNNINMIPFKVRNFFYIKSLKGVKRGAHAHKRYSQFIICLTGSCKFLVNDTKKNKEIKISKSEYGYLIPSKIWLEILFLEKNTSLICFTSGVYNESEYIRDFENFIKIKKL